MLRLILYMMVSEPDTGVTHPVILQTPPLFENEEVCKENTEKWVGYYESDKDVDVLDVESLCTVFTVPELKEADRI